MLVKSIGVSFDSKTFPKKKVPPSLGTAGVKNINLWEALLMLGETTIPGGNTPASPARYWAWIRYFSAIGIDPDLVITKPFQDLDPHQKTILSDDMGVAISMRWLFDQLGGLSSVVDGRRFVIQYMQHQVQKKKNTPKVGQGKCPDFVVRDKKGLWHIIECKGTQSDRSFLNKQLRLAMQQKSGIKIKRNIRGHSLGVGVLLAGEGPNKIASEIRVVDPKPNPEAYAVINKNGIERAKRVTRRLSLARALGQAGTDRLSEELSIPSRAGDLGNLLSASEKYRLERPLSDRADEAAFELKDSLRSLMRLESGNTQYLGRSAVFSISGPDFKKNTGFTSVTIEQGINKYVVDHLVEADSRSVISAAEDLVDNYAIDEEVDISSDKYSAVIKQGDFFFARMKFE